MSMVRMMSSLDPTFPTPTSATPHGGVDGGAFFPVVFFDGEREINLGTILISPSLTYKSFQSIISQKIGISPHQFTSYFTPLQHNHHHHHRRHPVTSKFNFSAAIPSATTSFFFVVLKRSRRHRRPRRPNKPPLNNNNFILLRRDPDPGPGLDPDLLNQYLLSIDLNSRVYDDLYEYGYGYGYGHGYEYDDGVSSSGGGSENRGVCEVCLNGDETVPFHSCKNDAVTVVFKSPAGPIGPPVKSRFP